MLSIEDLAASTFLLAVPRRDDGRLGHLLVDLACRSAGPIIGAHFTLRSSRVGR